MTGAISPNLHEGSRSEYLAQFVFSAWGTSVPVPHQEDYGLDLLCSLVERDGQRAWAHSPYTVQVKSEMKEWIFEGEKAVRWLVQHPSPLFLCVVDKSTARVRIYQTSQRFYIWGRGQLPSRIGLMPTTETEGVRPKWPDDNKEFSLGAPILDFSIEDFLQQDFVDKAQRTLRSWIEVDERNLSRRRNGIRKFVVPSKYKPNEPPNLNVSSSYKRWTGHATEEELEEATVPFMESLENIGMELFKRDDIRGAALVVLLQRHILPTELSPFINEVNDQVAWEPDNFSHSGIQQLEKAIDDVIEEAQRRRKTRET